jgi:hypothetical protein
MTFVSSADAYGEIAQRKLFMFLRFPRTQAQKLTQPWQLKTKRMLKFVFYGIGQREEEDEELLDIRKAKRETGSGSGSRRQIAFVWSKSIQCKNVYLFQSLPPRGLSSVALHLLA